MNFLNYSHYDRNLIVIIQTQCFFLIIDESQVLLRMKRLILFKIYEQRKMIESVLDNFYISFFNFFSSAEKSRARPNSLCNRKL